MIIYRCDRCKRDIDPGMYIFDGEEYLSLETKPYDYRGWSKNYILCKDCLKKFKDFINGCEVVMPLVLVVSLLKCLMRSAQSLALLLIGLRRTLFPI